MQFLSKLFDTRDFPARWHCGNWTSGHGWLHIVADLAIWAAYFAIPLVFGYFLVRRKDLPFRSIFLLFGAFIVLCGTTHLMEAVIFWWPGYRLAGAVKLLTAIVSWGTVFALVRTAPTILKMRSPEELELVVQQRTAQLNTAMTVLETERELLRTTLVSIGDAVITTDPAGLITNLNVAAEALTGWTAAAALGQPLDHVFLIVDEATRQRFLNPALTAVTQDAVVTFSSLTRLIAKDGVESPIDGSAARIRDRTGATLGCVLVFRDISEQQRRQGELRRAEQEREQALTTLRALVDAAPLGITILDLEQRYQLVNAPLAEINGFPVQAHLGRTIADVIPDLAPKVEPLFRRVLETGKPVVNQIVEGETSRLPGETRVWLESWFPIAERGSVPRAVGVVVQDVTDNIRDQQRFRLAAEAVNGIIYECNLITGAVERSRGLFEVVGYHPHEVPATGRWWIEQIHPDDRLRVTRIDPDLIRPPNASVEYRVRHKNGHWLDVEDRAVVVRDSSGRPIKLIGCTVDVTERKTAERQLVENRNSLYQLIEQCPFGIYIVDADFRIVSVNAGSQDKAFANVRPLIGRPFDEAMRIIWPEPVASECIRIFRETLATGRPYSSKDFVSPRADIDRTEGYEWELHRLTLPDGRNGVVCYYFDATRLRQVERELRESEQRYRLVGDAANDAIWDWDLITNRVTWNESVQRAFGYTAAQIGAEADWWLEQIHPDDRERISQSLSAVVDGQAETWSNEYRFKRADGSFATVYDRGQVVRDGRHATRMVGSMLDLSERKRLEDELREVAAKLSESNRRKDEFLAILAHELRNPLAPIRNGLQLMKLAAADAATVDQTRTMMERQLDQLVRLVDDLMDVSRISRGKISLRKERVELATVVAAAIETSRPLIEQRGHQLTVTLPPVPIMIDADVTRLAQVFMNLLNNAAKYTEHGGRIWLKAERHDSDVVVSIRDTGIGIPTEKLACIFEMFNQVDHTLEKSMGGLGIGLSLVKRLLEMHGGTIIAKSDGLGHGSEFIVRLPLVAELSAVASDPVDHVLPESSLRILIVDDNRDGCDSLAKMLKIKGNHTQTAYDGDEGVRRADEFRPDVVLLDIGLPKLNGYEACRVIRERPWAKTITLIAITGWGQEEDRTRSKEAGFDLHMVKPVDPTTLLKLLATLNKPHD